MRSRTVDPIRKQKVYQHSLFNYIKFAIEPTPTLLSRVQVRPELVVNKQLSMHLVALQ